jgi:ammonia channel protein AmtB
VTERLEDIEAYINNAARNGSTNAPSKIAGPGPGHNAWQMTSTALVLFMTLPGLALFYGLFVLAVAVHAPVGLRAILRETFGWRGPALDLATALFAAFLVWFGWRAVAGLFA